MPIKIASNELKRLYFMGFLKRRRVKKEIQLENGRSYCRGFKYLYSISKQAISYGKYQINKDKDHEWTRMVMEKEIENKYPKYQWDLIKQFVFETEKSKKVCPRFPKKIKY